MHHNLTPKKVSGQQLYDLDIPGGWNKSAIKQIADGVLAGVEDIDLQTYNFLTKLTNTLLVTGSIIIVDKKILEGEVIFIEEAEASQVALFLPKVPKNTQKTMQVWELFSDKVEVTTYTATTDAQKIKNVAELTAVLEKRPVVDTIIIPSTQGIIFIENGKGVLVPAAATLLRLFELSNLLQKAISEDALRWFVTAYGADINGLNDKLTAGAFGTLPDGATFEHMYDSSYTGDIFRQMEVLVPAFKEQVSNFVITPGESGIARYIGMLAYINIVKHTQKICSFVFEQYSETVEFTNPVFQSIRSELV